MSATLILISHQKEPTVPHPIDSSTLRILRPTGQTVGTGFLVSKNLVVTCAHVIKQLRADAGDRVYLCFTGKANSTSALVLPEYWRPDEATDIAILQVDEVPAGVFPLRMGRAGESRLKNDLYTFGYATAADEQGIGGLGTFITLKQEGNFIQFRMHEANHGHSGAPIYDDKRGVVVGMIKKGHTHLGRNEETTFAIPTETIWQVCLQLKPPTPVLPRRNPIVEGINLLPYDYDQRIQNFLGEYLGSDAHPVPFGGRDDALHMLDNWLAETTPYLLLAAPAGRGKSALLVRWLDSLSSREDLALTFVPVSIRFGTNMERVFYAALTARLAFLHGDDVPASPETSTAVYRGLVSDYLSKPLANGRTLLVVLDGLDEAADWQAGADFMPAELPAGVRVVVSARFLAGDADSTPWLRRLNWERSGLASAPSIVPLDRAGVADVLLKMGCPLDELSRNVDIVAELYRLSEGDPLLVSLYVGDLWAKGEEVTRLKPEDLAGIQPGYKGYFDRWWDDQEKLWGADTPLMRPNVQLLLNLLACALSGLIRGDLVRLAPQELNRYTLDNAFKALQRFVIGDGVNFGYTFSHPKLGQYFWDSLTPTEQAQMEGRFLAWGQETLQEFIDGKRDPKQKDQIPVYVVRNYGAHLARAKQPIGKWLPLIHHQQWAQAWLTVEGAYGGYLQDVQRFWEQCRTFDRNAIEAGGGVPNFGAQIRCALIETSLHSLAANIPEELIPVLVQTGLWTLPQAWVVIRQMPEPAQQAEAIIGLLSHLEDRQLSEALAVARAIQNEGDRASVLSKLAQRMPDGEMEQVLAAARAILDEKDRSSVLNDLVQRMPETIEEALAAAQAIQGEWHRADMLSDLAERLPDRELGQVLAAARAIQDEWSRARVLGDLAQRLPEVAGEALVAAQAIEDEWHRTSALSELAQQMPEAAEEALAAAQAVGNERSRVKVLGYMAERMPEVAKEALEAARAIQDEWFRAQVLSDLAQHLPEAVGEALAAAQAIQNEWDRAPVLSELAQRLPEGELKQVLTVTRAIQGEGYRANVLSDLAKRMPEGELEQVLAAARVIQNEWDRARVLSTLVQRLPKLAGEALAAARAIEHKKYRARILSELAQCLPEVAGEALAATRAIQDEGDCAHVLSVLVEHLPEVAGEALTAAWAIDDEWSRASVLGELAQHLPEVAGEVLAAARAIRNEWNRIHLLSTLAQRLPKGELEQVLAAARAIKDEAARARVLSDLAQRLPEAAEEALAAAQAIQHEESRARVLGDLAQCLPEWELGQVLAATWMIRDERHRTSVLNYLVQRLPARELREILVVARAIQNEWDRAHLLTTLAQRLPGVTGEALAAIEAIEHEEYRADRLSDLAQRLPENELEPVLAAARAIQHGGYRAAVLSDLALRLPELVGETLAVARAIQYEVDRASVLSNLVRCLPELAGEALESARAIQDGSDQDGWYYARALSELAQRMPEGELGQVLAAAWAIRGEDDRASVLSILAQRLLQGELGQVLEAAQTIHDKKARASVLSALAQPMIKIPSEKSLLPIETSLVEFSQRTRADLFSDLAALMPIIIHLGTDDTPREIYQAVRDVTTWWP
jgi:hypothetical protein